MKIKFELDIPAEEVARYEREGFRAYQQIILDVNALLYEEGKGSSCTALAGGFEVVQ